MSHQLTQMKAQREAGGFTIPTLAHRANVHDRTIRDLENGGRVGVDASQRIADALGVSLATLGKQDF